MGMMLHVRQEPAESEPAEAPRRRRKRKDKAEAPTTAPNATESAPSYADLTDEELFDAYTVTLPEGEATDRDEQIVELRAVAAFAHTFDA